MSGTSAGQGMSSHEKNIYISLISTLMMFGIYCALVPLLYEGSNFLYSTNTRLVGKSVLSLMAACVIANFCLRQLIKIIAALRKQPCERSVTDERDKMIELKGMQVSYAVFAIGFVVSMSMLWAGYPAVPVFNVIIFSLILGEVFSGLVKIIQYRRGY